MISWNQLHDFKTIIQVIILQLTGVTTVWNEAHVTSEKVKVPPLEPHSKSTPELESKAYFFTNTIPSSYIPLPSGPVEVHAWLRLGALVHFMYLASPPTDPNKPYSLLCLEGPFLPCKAKLSPNSAGQMSSLNPSSFTRPQYHLQLKSQLHLRPVSISQLSGQLKYFVLSWFPLSALDTGSPLKIKII